jgi:glycosyltransferase involved in cell wall biosynthesis
MTPPVPDESRLRVVHVAQSLHVGGLEGFLWYLARFADRARFAPSVLCLDAAGEWADRFSAAQIPVEALGGKRRPTWINVARLARRLFSLRPDIVHTHNVTAHLIGTLAARMARVPVVLNTKQGFVHPSGRLAAWVNRHAVSNCRRIVAVCSDTARCALEIEKLPPERVLIIPNGVDTDAYHPPAGRPASAGSHAIHVARLRPEKDQATLLRAVRLVVDRQPDFTLELVGDGYSRPELEALARRLNLQRQVVFLGVRQDVPALLGGAGLFVLSSLTEGTSLAVLEAMATGLAVVATDVGGNGEVVADGETGILVPPGDPSRLADAILTLVADPERAIRMGQAGRRRVERFFDVRSIVRRYEDLYLELRRRP